MLLSLYAGGGERKPKLILREKEFVAGALGTVWPQ
jgi:hypothetical protein